MKGIYFQSDKELIYFCEVIFRKYNEINVQWEKNKHWGNELQLLYSKLTNDQILTCFANVFLHLRLDQTIIKIIKDVYHFSDDTEIEYICALTKSIIADETMVQNIFGKEGNIALFITSLFQRYTNESEKVHYDALITFCMKPLSSCLETAVGYGIDEMKREEEHQSFIESIRGYLKAKSPKIECLYIIQGESFSFFKSNGELYSRLELRTLMIKEPLFIVGLDENEWNITPVITLHPKNIYIFGNRPTEAKTITLFNLFQERIQFLPLNQFPFKNLNLPRLESRDSWE